MEAVRDPRVERLVRADDAGDAHRRRLGGRALRLGLVHLELRDAQRRRERRRAGSRVRCLDVEHASRAPPARRGASRWRPTAKLASFGGCATRLPSAVSHSVAAGPPIRSVREPSCGSSSTSAIRQRGIRQLVGPRRSVTGAESARRTCAATGRRSAAVTRGGSSRTISCTGSREKDSSASRIAARAATRSRTRPVVPGVDRRLGALQVEHRLAARTVDRLRDARELVADRRAPVAGRRMHVEAGDARPEAAVAAERERSAATAQRRVDGGLPVRREAELVAADREAAPVRDEDERRRLDLVSVGLQAA